VRPRQHLLHAQRAAVVDAHGDGFKATRLRQRIERGVSASRRRDRRSGVENVLAVGKQVVDQRRSCSSPYDGGSHTRSVRPRADSIRSRGAVCWLAHPPSASSSPRRLNAGSAARR
jgi:hypothetical protein